jgi:hypothetical protein
VTAVLHILSEDSVVGANVVVEDVLACAAAGHPQWLVAANLPDHVRERLGNRVLPERAPSQQLRDVVVTARLQRVLRELSIRHPGVVVHAHGPAARAVAAFLSTTVLVDDGDERPAHRLLPSPARVVCTSHGDLDRHLDAGLPARQLVLVPPGIDGGMQRTRHERVLVDGVSARVVAALTAADIATCDWTAADAAGARAIVVGEIARCRPALVAAVASGTPCFALDVPWAEDLARCAAFKAIEADAVIELVRRSTPRQPRSLPKGMGRAARTEALLELLDTLGPPSLSRHFPRRHPRR